MQQNSVANQTNLQMEQDCADPSNRPPPAKGGLGRQGIRTTTKTTAAAAAPGCPPTAPPSTPADRPQTRFPAVSAAAGCPSRCPSTAPPLTPPAWPAACCPAAAPALGCPPPTPPLTPPASCENLGSLVYMMMPWSSTPQLGALPSVTTTLSHSSSCSRFAMPAGSSAIRTPSAVPLTPPPSSPALLHPEISSRASGLSTTPPTPLLRHPLLQPTLGCLAWVGWRSGGGESTPPAWPSRPSPALDPTATSTPPSPQHTSLLARPSSALAPPQ